MIELILTLTVYSCIIFYLQPSLQVPQSIHHLLLFLLLFIPLSLQPLALPLELLFVPLSSLSSSDRLFCSTYNRFWESLYAQLVFVAHFTLLLLLWFLLQAPKVFWELPTVFQLLELIHDVIFCGDGATLYDDLAFLLFLLYSQFIRELPHLLLLVCSYCKISLAVV